MHGLCELVGLEVAPHAFHETAARVTMVTGWAAGGWLKFTSPRRRPTFDSAAVFEPSIASARARIGALS